MIRKYYFEWKLNPPLIGICIVINETRIKLSVVSTELQPNESLNGRALLQVL